MADDNIFVILWKLNTIDSEDIQDDQRRVEHVESLLGVLGDLLPADLIPKQSDFFGIYGRVSIAHILNYNYLF